MKRTKRNGFTIVELVIVLIVIGLIISGVMKGKNLIKSADQKKIYNTWVKEWQATADSYEDRTGAILGDSKDNGGTGASEDGRCDNINLSSTVTVQDKLKAIGLEYPTGNVNGTNGGQYIIKGKYVTNKATAYLYFLASSSDGYKNKLYITGVPTDYAIAWDKLSDGKIDARSGNFRIYPDDKDWPDATKTKTVNVSLEL